MRQQWREQIYFVERQSNAREFERNYITPKLMCQVVYRYSKDNNQPIKARY